MWPQMDYYPSKRPLTRTSWAKLNLVSKLFLEGPLESVTFCPLAARTNWPQTFLHARAQHSTVAVTWKQALGGTPFCGEGRPTSNRDIFDIISIDFRENRDLRSESPWQSYLQATGFSPVKPRHVAENVFQLRGKNELWKELSRLIWWITTVSHYISITSQFLINNTQLPTGYMKPRSGFKSQHIHAKS